MVDKSLIYSCIFIVIAYLLHSCCFRVHEKMFMQRTKFRNCVFRTMAGMFIKQLLVVCYVDVSWLESIDSLILSHNTGHCRVIVSDNVPQLCSVRCWLSPCVVYVRVCGWGCELNSRAQPQSPRARKYTKNVFPTNELNM